MGFFQFWGAVIEVAFSFAYASPFQLRLISRKVGTVGNLFPAVFISQFIMLFCPSIHAWNFVKYSTLLMVVHFTVYCWKHKQGTGVHHGYVGDPYLNNQYVNDAVFGGVMALIFIGDPFCYYWLLQIVMSFVSLEMLSLRDSARKRAVTSEMIEAAYWRSMLGDSNDRDDEELGS